MSLDLTGNEQTNQYHMKVRTNIVLCENIHGMADNGLSPVIGVILLTAVTVGLVSVGAVFVFDVSETQSSQQTNFVVNIQNTNTSEDSISVQLVRGSDVDYLLVTGTAVDRDKKINPTVGRTATIQASTGGTVNVIAVSNDGSERLVAEKVVESTNVPRNGILGYTTGYYYAYFQDPNNGTIIESVKNSDNNALSISFSPSGERVAYSSYNYVWVYDTRTWNQTAEIPVNDSASVEWSPAGDQLALSYEEVIVVKDTDDFETDKVLARANSSVIGLSWGSNADRIAYGTGNGNVFIHQSGPSYTLEKNISRASSLVYDISYTSNAKQIAYGTSDGILYIHNTDTYDLNTTLTQASDRVIAVEWSPTNTHIAYGSTDTNVYIHDVSSSYPLNDTLTQSGFRFQSLTWSPEGDKIAYGDADGSAASVYIHNKTAGFPLNNTLTNPSAPVYGIDWQDK